MTTLLAFEFPTLAVLLGLAGFMLARLLRLWPEGAVGTLAGAGAVCLLIGLLNLGGGRPCPASPATSLSDILAAPDSQASSCGGVASLPLLAAGSLSLVAGALPVLGQRAARALMRHQAAQRSPSSCYVVMAGISLGVCDRLGASQPY
jgi:hypothetical protein